MIESEELLAAIVENPWDDGPRLIYADWLDEKGSTERAEFIRTQIQLSRINQYHADYTFLKQRERELLKDFSSQWKIPGLKARQEFTRGFVEFVWVRGDFLLAESKRIANAPTVKRLRVSAVDRRMNDLAKLPWLSRLTELDLTNNSAVRYLLAGWLDDVNVSNLKSLILRNVRMWPEDIALLLNHQRFPALIQLDVSGNPLSDEGAQAIAQSDKVKELQQLILRSDGLDASDTIHSAGFSSLANARFVRNISYLDLTGHHPGTVGLLAILQTLATQAIEHLCLPLKGFENYAGDWLLPLTQNNRNFAKLKVLVLTGRFPKIENAHDLANWHRLKAGTILDLRRVDFNPGERESFLKSPFLNQIFMPDEKS